MRPNACVLVLIAIIALVGSVANLAAVCRDWFRARENDRTTRHPGYAVSLRKRKPIEDVFGWMTTAAGLRETRHRGTARVGWVFTLTAAAYNLVRMPKLPGAAAERGLESVRGGPDDAIFGVRVGEIRKNHLHFACRARQKGRKSFGLRQFSATC